MAVGGGRLASVAVEQVSRPGAGNDASKHRAMAKTGLETRSTGRGIGNVAELAKVPFLLGAQRGNTGMFRYGERFVKSKPRPVNRCSSCQGD